MGFPETRDSFTWDRRVDSLIITNLLLACLILVYVAVNWETILETFLEVKWSSVVVILLWLVLGWIWFETTLIYFEYGGPRAGFADLFKRYEDIFGFGNLAAVQAVFWIFGLLGVVHLMFNVKGYLESFRVWFKLWKLKRDRESKNR